MRLAPNRATNRATVSDLGFRDTTNTAQPPFNTRPATSDCPSGYRCTPQVGARVVGTNKGRAVGFSPRGLLSDRIPVLGCCPSCPWGRAQLFWSATVAAQTVRLTVRLSLTWGSAAPEISSYPPSTPDRRHQIAPPGIPVPPVRAPRETVPERLRPRPDTAVPPASDGCCGPRHGGSPQRLEVIAVISRLLARKPGVPTPCLPDECQVL